MTPLAIAGLGTPELLIILAIIILLFGASKLPELARGSGRALRIFKAETKGLTDDDERRRPTTARAARARGPAGRPSSTPAGRARRASASAATTRHRLTAARRRPCPSPASSTCCAVDRTTPSGADGRMALSDHLRELRARLIRSALFLLVAFVVALFFYDQLLEPGAGALQPRPGRSCGQKTQTDGVRRRAPPAR